MNTHGHRWLPRSFRSQLAAGFALLSAVLGLVLSLVLGSMLAQSSRHEAGTLLNAVAGNSARLLADGLSLRLREVEALAASPTLWSDGLAAPRVAQALGRSQALNPYSAWIGVTDAQGRVRLATGNLLLGVDVSERPWFQQGRQGPHVGDVHPAKLLAGLLPPAGDGAPQRFVDFAAPIRQGGQVVGVLCMHGSWEWMQATIESLLPEPALRKGVEVFVFDRQGKMIFAPDAQLALHVAPGQSLPRAGHATAATASAAARNGAAVVAWNDGEAQLTASAALPLRQRASDLGWTVVARQPVAAAHAAARHGAKVALLLGLAAAVLAALMGWLLAARLTQPLRQMARDAQALQASATPLTLPAHSGSREVEQLSAALSGMTERLLQANAELETRVQARTAELQRANAALARLAHHDPLTGVLNRRGLDEQLAQALAGTRRRRAPLSLLLLDIDHFKRVNDTHGHDVGDQVLQALARVLRQHLREVDLVARIGGEEFLVVLPDTGTFGASQVAANLVETMQYTDWPIVDRVTISCGVAEVGTGADAAAQALKLADTALYRAKNGGRNRYCIADSGGAGNAVARARIDLQTDARAEAPAAPQLAVL